MEDHLFNLTELTRQHITVIMQASHIKTFRQISQDGQMGRIKMQWKCVSYDGILLIYPETELLVNREGLHIALK